jgi:periplasmic protein TonB
MSDTTLIDQLDEGIELLLAEPKVELQASDRVLAELLRLAGDLSVLPSPEFREQLKAELLDQVEVNGEVGKRVMRRDVGHTARQVGLPTFLGAGSDLYPVHRSSFMASLVAHATAVALIVTSGIWAAQGVHEVPRVSYHLVVSDVSPYILPAADDKTGGGGGGGDQDKLQATKGEPPKFSREQVAPPAVVVRNEDPKLAVDPTVVGPPIISFPPGPTGDPLSGVIGTPSNGTGTGGGIGSGRDGGVGIGAGRGVGTGEGGGIGGGFYHPGRGVSAPRAIYDPEPEYSDEARKAKYQGSVLLLVFVGADGRPHEVRVQRSLGMGLDEKALEAVRLWRFEPATKDGLPVAVMVNIEVNFRLY